MVLPTAVNAKLISLIEDSIETYNFLTVPIEGSEDTSPQAKPNTVIWADFDDQATLDSKKNYPTTLPCSIYVAFTSAGCSTAAESFNKAFIAIITILKIFSENHYYQILNTENVPENVHLQLQNMPIVITRKSAAGSTVQLQMFYDISI